ncbi:TIGR04219 family outer membrane beta-barrel protein [Shewanella avicenniae]|uniref:TIGR04219 family outer membrane beta-barrel protein n=1 Tax=Shewanella avicenniae TaxID=2814294 RepID=A0ABX7QS83_9GAMM|nr:TIGR04219 family outer membrane beta-barrel protein [Shewanella avicenniae]QSX34307.1 TIGR04219 family outer membrane beta-barrel protein [Shewanella avicenniae]
MKISCIALMLVSAFAASSANAATVLGVKVGGDLLWAESTGALAELHHAKQNIDYKDTAQYSVWLNLEHPIPLLPNLRIRENHLETDGRLADAEFVFQGVDYTGSVKGTADLSNTDFVLYYEVFDNDILSVDLGGAYKKFSGEYRMSQDNFAGSIELDGGVYMGYASAEVSLITTGLFAYGELLAGIDYNSIRDYQVGLGWQFDGVALDTRVRLGYRQFNFEDPSFSGVTADMRFSGVTAGVEIVF